MANCAGVSRVAALVVAAFLVVMGSGCDGDTSGGETPDGGTSDGGTTDGGTTDGGTTDGGANTGDVLGDWTIATGANAEDLVENMTFSYTVSVNLTTARISYTDPSTGSGATASVPTSGSTVITLNTDTSKPATMTFTKDDFGFSVTSNTPSGQFAKLVLSGDYSGSITIDSNKKMGLSLSGVSVTSTNGPALNVQTGKRVFVVLEGSNVLKEVATSAWTARTLADGTGMDLKATFFGEGPLIFSGAGSLTVAGKTKHAICSDEHVRVRQGTLTLTSTSKDGIHANQAFVMDDGNVTITSTSGKGINVEGKEDEETPLGFIAINGGTLSVNSCTDGIKTSFDPTATDEVETAATTDDPAPVITINGGTITVTVTPTSACSGTSSDPEKHKGIQSMSHLTVTGGTVKSSVNSTSTNTDLTEGIESKGVLTINGGTVEAYAFGDAINAGQAFVLNGGRVYAKSGSTGDTDAIDSNGTLTINGGVLVALGSAQSPGDALDSESAFTINGGTVVTVGARPMRGPTAKTTVLKLSASSSTWRSSLDSKILTVGTTATSPVLAFELPAMSPSGTMEIFIAHGGLTSGSYGIFTGGTASSGSPFHGLHYEGVTASGGANLGTFTASGGLVTVSK